MIANAPLARSWITNSLLATLRLRLNTAHDSPPLIIHC